MTVTIKRIYDAKDNKGTRILVDRVWPRGISKEDAHLDHWLKEVAPTSELRKWFNHDPKLYAAFKEKYEKELRENDDQNEAFEELQEIARSNNDIVLLYAAKDTEHNQAVVLKELLENK
ncbi:DUF488 domain-containing protein [Staphylococcus kloosii]|jgi:uncharacterized protein YeaO (DUF488 family)|uniref:MarR family transcriptional regulator n=1 Tax=Staphylococcus kloosii TaxID=29384 RepID=A0ABQ0XJ54_9STAP|nr:DUF488 domain-containing protein [Staphylococcus kloosii]AVQ35055.1 DUF488 domain-containing protein [Staphylococcus kloosii]PNZ03467.1 DUF488 domain-containing protein [Staphylococcus kloosii]GEP81487.1 hypothetical protein SKL01_06650 [Staphylococcus kloosii]SUM48093.1 Putative cytosolic protein [Staphylococcus kloosii]